MLNYSVAELRINTSEIRYAHYTLDSTSVLLHPLPNKLIYGNNLIYIGTSYRSTSQRKRNLRNIIKQKQPRTTYASELRQRSLSVAKDLFLDAKLQPYFEFPKDFEKKILIYHLFLYYIQLHLLHNNLLYLFSQ